MAKIVELIYVEAYRGSGTEKDPSRTVHQWFEKDGTLVYERDNWEQQQAFLRTEADFNREVHERVKREVAQVVDQVQRKPKVARVIGQASGGGVPQVLLITTIEHAPNGDYIVFVELPQ